MKVPWHVWVVSACAIVAWVQLGLYHGDWVLWAVNAGTLVACTAAATMRPVPDPEPPSPPVNVRLIYPDGAVLPLECRYEGRGADGLHVWVAVGLPPLVAGMPGMRLAADQLPAHTRLTVDVQESD